MELAGSIWQHRAARGQKLTRLDPQLKKGPDFLRCLQPPSPAGIIIGPAAYFDWGKTDKHDSPDCNAEFKRAAESLTLLQETQYDDELEIGRW